jgi:hypothetical protein
MLKILLSLLLCTSLYAQDGTSKKVDRLSFLKKEQAKVEKMIKDGQNDGQLVKYLKDIKSERSKLASDVKKAKVKEEKELKKVATKKQEKARRIVISKPKKRKKKRSVAPLLIKHDVKIDRSKSLRDQLSETLRLLDRESDNLILLTEVGVNSRARKVASANIDYLNGEKTRIMTALKDSKKKNLSAFTYKGHMQIRNESADNRQGVQGSRQSNQTFYRLRSYLSFSPNENLSLNLTPQAVSSFGNQQSTISHDTLEFYEANIDYSLNSHLKAKIGRQELSYGDHLIIGALPWLNQARSFDGVKLTATHKLGSSDIMYSKVSDNGTAVLAGDDSNLFMWYNKMSFGPLVKEADFYVMHRDDDTSTQEEVNTIGFRVKGSHKNIFYRTENAIQNGGNVGDDAYQYNVEVGGSYKSFKGSFEYASAGADYIQMYPTAHKFLGFADVLGRRNLNHIAVHGSVGIMSWLSLRADFHSFKRNDTTKSAFKLNGSSTWGVNGTSDDVGTELDVVLTLKTKDNLKLQLGGAWFNPGDYMKAQQGNDKVTQFTYAQILATF